MPKQRPRDFLRKLGARIRARRLHSGKPRHAVAAELKISPAMLQRYESGDGHPPAYVLHRIALALGTSTSALLAEDNRGNQEQIDAMMALYADPAVGSVIRYMQGMDKASRGNLQAIAATFAARSQASMNTAEVMR
jgi:transcriptional regulator with XRE-family HTH domain